MLEGGAHNNIGLIHFQELLTMTPQVEEISDMNS